MNHFLPVVSKAHQRYPAFSKIVATYALLYLFWFITLGYQTWHPGWPWLRTFFVLSIIALSLWSIGLVAYAAWYYAFSPSHYGYYVLPQSQTSSCSKASKQASQSHVTFRLAFVGLLLSLFLCATYRQPLDRRYKAEVDYAVKFPSPHGNFRSKRVFIAAMFHDNEKIVPYWSREIIKTIHYLGTENVFVSIVESYSHDDTSNHLLALQGQLNALGVQNKILVEETRVERPPNMETRLPRIEYLAALRNLALEPLNDWGDVDIVLFSNDVYVEAESIVELLHTGEGDWDMVCAIDLTYWGLYDAWVTRDAAGKLVSSLWPYFMDDAGSRAVNNEMPAPVFTCWNGLVAIRADPFLPPERRHSSSLSNTTLPNLPATHPAYDTYHNTSPAEMPPLRFRASAPTECFSSECFLLPYDLRRQYDLQKIFMNTRVITAYEWRFYVWYKYILRHWLLKWYIEVIEGVNKEAMKQARLIVGKPENVWTWDGGECHPIAWTLPAVAQ